MKKSSNTALAPVHGVRRGSTPDLNRANRRVDLARRQESIRFDRQARDSKLPWLSCVFILRQESVRRRREYGYVARQVSLGKRGAALNKQESLRSSQRAVQGKRRLGRQAGTQHKPM